MQTKKAMVLGGVATALLLVGAVVIAQTQTRSYFVPSGNMLPNLAIGSRVQVKVSPYQKMADVGRGDVIVHSLTNKSGRVDLIRRVIGLPGDTIALSGTTISINGQVLPHQLVRKTGKVSIFTETNGAATYQVQYGDNLAPAPAFKGVVPAGQLFCLGDNRDNSYDSRYTGSVFFGEVSGKKVP